jgi:hypothetical protein
MEMAPTPRRPTAQELLEGLRTTLTSRLPSTWSVEVQPWERESGGSSNRPTPDATLTVRAPDGREATVPVEVEQKLDPKDVAPLVAQLHQMTGPDATERPLVVAPYLSSRTQDLLAASGISYATGGPMLYGISGGVPHTSTSGTISFSLTDPATAIDIVGTEKNPWTAEREQPLRTLRGPTAGRVVRALCDFRPPYGVQELAERSETPIGSVSRVLSLLDREALITRTPRGAITDVQWADLIRRWAQDYTFSKANIVSTYLEPRGLSALLDKLRQTGVRYAVTGSMAAALLAPVTVPRLLSIYVDNLNEAAHELQLRPAERGANVVLAEPFNPVVFDRTQEIDGVQYAAPTQVAADLLTGPGRSPAEADALLQWMTENEDAWRA